MLRADCWLWALIIAIPQSGGHSFLPWETTSGPTCAGHGLGDSNWQSDILVLGHGQTVIQANLADSWYRLLTGSLVRTLSPLAVNAHQRGLVTAHALGCLFQTSVNSQLIEFCFSLFLDSFPLFYYTNNLTLYHRKIFPYLRQKRTDSNTWLSLISQDGEPDEKESCREQYLTLHFAVWPVIPVQICHFVSF